MKILFCGSFLSFCAVRSREGREVCKRNATFALHAGIIEPKEEEGSPRKEMKKKGKRRKKLGAVTTRYVKNGVGIVLLKKHL